MHFNQCQLLIVYEINFLYFDIVPNRNLWKQEITLKNETANKI